MPTAARYCSRAGRERSRRSAVGSPTTTAGRASGQCRASRSACSSWARACRSAQGSPSASRWTGSSPEGTSAEPSSPSALPNPAPCGRSARGPGSRCRSPLGLAVRTRSCRVEMASCQGIVRAPVRSSAVSASTSKREPGTSVKRTRTRSSPSKTGSTSSSRWSATAERIATSTPRCPPATARLRMTGERGARLVASYGSGEAGCGMVLIVSRCRAPVRLSARACALRTGARYPWGPPRIPASGFGGDGGRDMGAGTHGAGRGVRASVGGTDMGMTRSASVGRAGQFLFRSGRGGGSGGTGGVLSWGSRAGWPCRCSSVRTSS